MVKEFTEEEREKYKEQIQLIAVEQSYTDAGILFWKWALSELPKVCDLYNEKGEQIQSGVFDWDVYLAAQKEFLLFKERRGLIKINREGDEKEPLPTATQPDE